MEKNKISRREFLTGRIAARDDLPPITFPLAIAGMALGVVGMVTPSTSAFLKSADYNSLGDPRYVQRDPGVFQTAICLLQGKNLTAAITVSPDPGSANPALTAQDENGNLIFQFNQGAIPPLANNSSFGSAVGTSRLQVYENAGFMTFDSEDNVSQWNLKRAKWSKGFGNTFRHESVAVNNAAYTVLAGDTDVFVTAGSTNRVITLPSAGSNIGQYVGVWKVDTGTGQVQVTRAGSDTVEGAVSVNLTAQYDRCLLVSRTSGSWFKRIVKVGGVIG